MPKPSFFIVGAPKCGTTSLCHSLSQHPEIFIPGEKEMNFFASDLDMPRFYDSVSEYLKSFENASKMVSGEATTWYLYSRTAAKEIRHFNSSARIIIALRQPTDMVYSLFRHRRYRGMESLPSLRQVLDREAAYMSELDGTARTNTTLIYSQAAKYFKQVQKYIETFGVANVHLVMFDEIVREPEAVYRGVLRFLGVNDDFRTPFPNANKTGRVRSERLRQGLDHPSATVKRLAHAFPQPVRRRAYWALRRMNISYGPPPPLDPELRRRLDDKFRPDVERLSTLIGRDLSCWWAK